MDKNSSSCRDENYFRVTGKLDDSSEQFIKKIVNWRVDVSDLMNIKTSKTDNCQGLMSPVMALGPRLDVKSKIFIEFLKPRVFLLYVSYEFLLDLNLEDIEHNLSILDCKNSSGISQKLNRFDSLDKLKTYNKFMYTLEEEKIFKYLKFSTIEDPSYVLIRLETSIKLRHACYFKFFNDYKIMLHSSKIYDLEVTVDKEHRFKAHKAILAARSPVFSAMLTSDFKEARTNLLEINDVSPEAFELFLHFLYTEEIKSDLEVFQNKLSEILYLAEKYSTDTLKNICQLYLIRDISINNVIELFILADRYNASLLRNYCAKSIRRLHDRSYKSFTSMCKSRLGKSVFEGILEETTISGTYACENKPFFNTKAKFDYKDTIDLTND